MGRIHLVKKRGLGEEVKPHFALFISTSRVKVVSVFGYFDGFQDDVGTVSVDVSKASVLSKSMLSLSSATSNLLSPVRCREYYDILVEM
jgi:hypothetical protein